MLWVCEEHICPGLVIGQCETNIFLKNSDVLPRIFVLLCVVFCLVFFFFLVISCKKSKMNIDVKANLQSIKESTAEAKAEPA